MILGDDGPAVAKQLYVPPARIDHGLDGERHSRFERETGAGLPVMQHLRVFVEHPADSVAAILAQDGVALALDEALDCVSKVAEAIARRHSPDAAPHCLEPDVAKSPRLD